jgi:hypothetical protein
MADVTQVNFEGGLNAVAAPHAVAANEVISATNVDFSLEWGGAFCRRGSKQIGATSVTQAVRLVNRSYNNGLDSSPWYTLGSSFAGAPAIAERGTMVNGTITFNEIRANLTGTPSLPTFTSYQNYAYMAAGSMAIRDDGTNTFDWVFPKPDQPTVTQQNYTYGTFTAFNGLLTAVEGSVTFAGGGTPALTTATSQTGTRITLTGTLLSGNNWENPIPLTHPIDAYDLIPPGTATYTIGPYGIDYTPLYLPTPATLVRISKDFSIGDGSFTNYWHTETTLADIQSAEPDPAALLLNEQGTVSIQIQHSYADKVNPVIGRRLKNRPGVPVVGRAASLIEDVSYTATIWGTPRTDYQLIGTLPNPTWTNIQAVRYIADFTSSSQLLIGGVYTYGSEFSNLTDTTNGLSYFQTLARVENGVITAESTPSEPSPPLKIQNGNTQLSFLAFTGTATTGITHRVIYRQGGLLQDAYQLGSIPVGSNFANDYALPDLFVVGNPVLNRNLWSSWPANGVNAISEPFHERIFLGSSQNIYWTAPGAPTNIQNASKTVVSNQGDTVQAFSVWDRLIIVNQNTVYEMDGTIFEGPNQDWVLRKTGARRGSAAPSTVVKTPQGVVLFGYDGISLYYPGYGIDVPLEWLYEKIGDLWKGTASTDPSAQKALQAGVLRVPALNFNAIGNSIAVYGDNKLYLGVPTNLNAQTDAGAAPDTVFAIDLARQKVWMYNYGAQHPRGFFWDYIQNRFVAGGNNQNIYQFETGLGDVDQLGNPTPIFWTFYTREWTTPVDMVVENLQVEDLAPGGQIQVSGFVDTLAQNLGTLTNTSKKWTPMAVNGTVGDRVSFVFSGTQSGSGQQGVTGLKWDSLNQVPKVTYYQTEFFSIKDQGWFKSDLEGWWHDYLAEIDTLGTATVSATVILDHQPIGFFTLTSTNTAMTGFNFALPSESYGNVAYVIYHSTTPFKHYRTWYNVDPEPTRALFFETDNITVPSENFIKTWVPTLNPLGGSVQCDIHVDGSIVYSTNVTGVLKKDFEFGLPNITTGKTIRATYTSTTPLKHYKTNFEFEAKPFGKLEWLVTYKKLGATTQFDMVRFWALDVEGTANTLLTNTWYIDGAVIGTNTLTMTTPGISSIVGRDYIDQIPFPPGQRGYLFQQLITSNNPFRVWRSHVQIERVGVKGFSRLTLAGTPTDRTTGQEQQAGEQT